MSRPNLRNDPLTHLARERCSSIALLLTHVADAHDRFAIDRRIAIARLVLVALLTGLIGTGIVEESGTAQKVWAQSDRIHPSFAPAVAQVLAEGFPGTILAPTPDARFFDALHTMGARVVSDGVTGPDQFTGMPAYTLRIGVENGDPQLVVLEGALGRALFDFTVGRLDQDCDGESDYCAWAFLVRGPPMVEMFSHLSIHGSPAVVEHITCCNGEHWVVTWCGERCGQTYRLSVSLIMARLLGADGLAPANRVIAQKLVDIAESLVSARP